MDWPTRTHSLSESGLGSFRYGQGKCTVLRKLVLDQAVCCWDIDSEIAWERWLEKDKFVHDGVPSSGLIVLLCSRHPTEPDGPSYLPFSAQAFVEISQKFHVPETTARTICRGDTYFSRSISSEKGSDNGRILYTARMSMQWEDDLGLSATYLQEIGLTVAVVYGCSEEQMAEIHRRMELGQDFVEHPMLIAGIFAELERQRMKGKIEKLVDKFVMGTYNIYTEGRSLREVLNTEGQRISDILDLYNDARSFLRGLHAIKTQLRKMIEHISELESRAENGRENKDIRLIFPSEENRARGQHLKEAGDIIRERLVEISEEYGTSIEDCRMVIEDTPVHTQMVLSRIARQEAETNTSLARTNTELAEATKRDNAQMKALAALTTLYLPLSTVASVFSMGVFNWNAGDGQSVISMYFWIFAIIAVAMTLLTGGLWCLITRPWNSQQSKKIDYLEEGKLA